MKFKPTANKTKYLFKNTNKYREISILKADLKQMFIIKLSIYSPVKGDICGRRSLYHNWITSG